MVSATQEILLKDVQFDYEDPIALFEQWDANNVVQKIGKTYFGLDTFEKMNALVAKQDFATVLKHVWTEKNLDKKLEWLRSVEHIAHPILLTELVITESQKDHSSHWLKTRILPITDIVLFRIAQDALYFNTKEHPPLYQVFEKRLLIGVKDLHYYWVHENPVEYINRNPECIKNYEFIKVKHFMEKHPELFPAPLWMVPFYKEYTNSDTVTIRSLEQLNHYRQMFGNEETLSILLGNSPAA
jgi:hypothetical protein